MKKVTITIHCRDNNNKQISGYLFMYEDIPLVVDKRGKNYWVVSEYTTGLKIDYGNTRKDAISNAKNRIDLKTPAYAKDCISNAKVLNIFPEV